MLSNVYRQLSVNLMMQVIRGGQLQGGQYLAREHRAIVDAFDAARSAARPAGDPRRTSSPAKRIALDAIDRAGGALVAHGDATLRSRRVRPNQRRLGRPSEARPIPGADGRVRGGDLAEEWDAANAAFHEFQIDLAGNEMLSHVYRELSVNLMMQVIRGGRLEGGEYLAREHRAIVDAFDAGDPAAAQLAIRTHIESGKAIALDAIDRSGGVSLARRLSTRRRCSIGAGRSNPDRRTPLGSRRWATSSTHASSTPAWR